MPRPTPAPITRVMRSRAIEPTSSGSTRKNSTMKPLNGSAAEPQVDGGVLDDHEPGRIVRTKEHPATPMTTDDALSQMELVGHDFFLFHDKESDKP